MVRGGLDNIEEEERMLVEATKHKESTEYIEEGYWYQLQCNALDLIQPRRKFQFLDLDHVG